MLNSATSWEREIKTSYRSDTWIFILLAFFHAKCITLRLRIMSYKLGISPSLLRIILVPTVQAQLLIVVTFTLKSAPVWMINYGAILYKSFKKSYL